MTARRVRPLSLALAAGLVAAPAAAQGIAPAGPGAEGPPVAWIWHGEQRLQREDPVGAWQAFRAALRWIGTGPGPNLGLGKVHLVLGNPGFAQSYAESVLQDVPDDQDGMALCVRALIRARSFDAAVQRAAAFVAGAAEPSAELLAARASALFRVQRIDDAAAIYRRVAALDPDSAEAHLRLGSGLLGPMQLAPSPDLDRAAAALARGERQAAIAMLRQILARHPDHAVAHRLLGETLFAARTAASMALADGAFAALASALPQPDVRGLPAEEFVPGYRQLPPERRRIVDRTLASFAGHIDRLVAVGARHDLLRELERTTDAASRRSLRGQRTFDGRVWDDVRGVGGVEAATGIEALDDAAAFGFDTFAHEVAHQVHFLGLNPVQRARIRALYRQAMAERRCLDYYAASNEAEYFGQGVEAFISLAKRPGGETTHGHTRFELLRLDPDLHDFIAGLVSHDPLRLPGRERVLETAVAVALRCGREADAVVAAGLLPPGAARDRLLPRAEAALLAARCH